MSDETTAVQLPQVGVDKVIEITIRSNVPNIGKTSIASRLMRVLKSEFKVEHALTDNAAGDIQDATWLLNTQGPPALTGVTVFIIDDDGAVSPNTIKVLEEQGSASYNNLLRALPPVDPAGTDNDPTTSPGNAATDNGAGT